MAEIIGGIGTSHVPSIAGAIAANRQDEPNWKPFFDSYKPVHDWLAQRRPDVIVVVYNDHGLNFFLDTIPTFAVGAAANYAGEDEGWGIPPAPSFDGFPELSWHLIESAVDDGFDITMCQNLVVDHGFSVPMSLFYPPPMDVPVKVVPVCVNTVQHPLPRPDRALALGRSLGRAIESYPGDEKVVIAGTGGLSHQLDGERAGSSTASSTCAASTPSSTTPIGLPATRSTSSSKRPGLKESKSSCGYSCAALSMIRSPSCTATTTSPSPTPRQACCSSTTPLDLGTARIRKQYVGPQTKLGCAP